MMMLLLLRWPAGSARPRTARTLTAWAWRWAPWTARPAGTARGTRRRWRSAGKTLGEQHMQALALGRVQLWLELSQNAQAFLPLIRPQPGDLIDQPIDPRHVHLRARKFGRRLVSHLLNFPGTLPPRENVLFQLSAHCRTLAVVEAKIVDQHFDGARTDARRWWRGRRRQVPLDDRRRDPAAVNKARQHERIEQKGQA